MFVGGLPWFLRLLRLRSVRLVLMLSSGLLLRSRGFGCCLSWMLVGSFTSRVSVRCRFGMLVLLLLTAVLVPCPGWDRGFEFRSFLRSKCG